MRPEQSLYASSSCEALGVYTPISTARFSADNVLSHLQNDWTDAEVDNRTALIARAAAYAGYDYVMLGEMFCSAAVDNGPELQQPQIFDLAVQRFTTAIDAAQTVGNDTLLNMARVGRARALLDLGRPAEAAADARLVPEGFVLTASASNASGRRQNRVYEQNFGGAISVGPAYRNVTYAGTADPRVRVLETTDTATEGTVIFQQTKYSDYSSPIPVASWEEAQLIVAEADLASGDVQGAVDIINELHARAGLPPYSGSDPAAVKDQLIEERSRELFLEGQHLHDVARYDLPLTPAPGTQYRKGGTYGSETCLPLPDVERLNNPNIG